MPHWDGKRAGLIHDAIASVIGTVTVESDRAQLFQIMRRAKLASTTVSTTPSELRSIHSELCGYCIRKSLHNCKGHEYQTECAFMEAAFGLRTSQFDRLT